MQDKKFIFVGHQADLEQGWAIFRYAILSAEEELHFEEKITFPCVATDVPAELLKSLLDSLLLILGISYWKLYYPKVIELGSLILNKEQAEFWNTVYTKGLGEFFYKNNIDFRNLIQFPYAEKKTSSTIEFPRKDRSLLLVGGGKDSIVSYELLKKSEKAFTGFVVNNSRVQADVIKIMGIDKIVLKREIDPLLLQLNKEQGVSNGHVPVSAVYAFLGLFAAVLYDYRYIIASNEESANYGNVEYLGEAINHQWSKSLEFENLFSRYVQTFITPNLYYFSLLRPLKEIKITEIFSKYPNYFSAFSSCNRNFRIQRTMESKKWCGECPKCLFIFTMFSTFLPKEKLLKIFAKNLFTDEKLLTLFQELLGIGDIKPFECVGIPQEMQFALFLTSKKGEFANDYLMKFFEKEVLPSIQTDALENTLSIDQTPTIPDQFKNIFTSL